MRVKPMKSGVFSETCGFGGVFHSGIGGMSVGEDAAAARGKVSLTRGCDSDAVLYLGRGGVVGDAEGRGVGSSSEAMADLDVGDEVGESKWVTTLWYNPA